MENLFLNRYPYTDFHELNLSWIIEMLSQVEKTLNDFVSINALKYADPIQWNITSQYEKNTIVIDPISGVAYISVQPVPSGVALTNTDYWTVVFDLGQFVVRASKNFSVHYENDTTTSATFASTAGDWLVWGDTLYKALVNITPGDTYVVGGNIEHFTMEELVGHLEDLSTTDKTSIVNAINELVTTIGDLDNLTTTDKTSIVNAINELVIKIFDLKYITLNDVQYPLHITTNTTLNVPTEFTSANDALNSYLKYCTIADDVIVTIKYSDGSYTGTQLSINSKNVSYLRVIGNMEHPDNCVVNLYYDPNYTEGWQCGFDIQNCSIDLIAGFHVIGHGMRSVDGDNHVNWLRDYQQIGVNCWSGASVRVKSMICENCYYPYEIGNGSFMTLLSDEDYLNGIGSTPTPSNISNYYGKYCIAIGGGDCGVFVYNGSGAELQGAIMLNTEDYPHNLGHGLISEHGCGVKCYGCASGYNYISGITSSDGSGLSYLNHGQLYNNGVQGACSRFSSAVELVDCKVFNNAHEGISALDTSSIQTLYVNTSNNENGLLAQQNAVIFTNAIVSNDINHSALALDNAILTNPSGITGTSPLGIRQRITKGNTPPSNGYYGLGDICYNTDPSTNNIVGWFVVTAGNPASWRAFYKGGYNGLVSGEGSPVIGDWYFDLGRKNFSFFDGTEWTLASRNMPISYPTTPIVGSCMFDATRKFPVYYNGTEWTSAMPYGATADRPQYPTTGMYYFDQTINKPVWWNGVNWVDATGTIS